MNHGSRYAMDTQRIYTVVLICMSPRQLALFLYFHLAQFGSSNYLARRVFHLKVSSTLRIVHSNISYQIEFIDESTAHNLGKEKCKKKIAFTASWENN